MADKTEKKDKPIQRYEVLLCVTGGIACFKSAELASALVQAGAGVTVAMTAAAERFITPLTFQTLTARPVYSSLWQSSDDFRSQHISLTERADLMIVAPATADILAKMACGLADDLVSTMALAANGACAMLLAPAMNTRMWQAPPTQANIEKLKSWGAHIIGPAEGRLACGTVGPGRMIDPQQILKAACDILRKNPPKNAR